MEFTIFVTYGNSAFPFSFKCFNFSETVNHCCIQIFVMENLKFNYYADLKPAYSFTLWFHIVFCE